MRFAPVLLFLALAVSGATAAPGGQSMYSDAQAGLAVRLPTYWHVVNRRLTPCTDPAEVLTVVGRGALVMLQERLGGGRGFAPRPDRFELRGKPSPMECCAPRAAPGWWFSFADHGRGFYAYVYLGGPGSSTEALSILNSLRLSRPRA